MTKINIIDSVKKFHGRENENVNLWFDRYEVILEIAGSSSEAAKLMPLFLEDAAYATWAQMEESVKCDLRQVRKEFQRVFGITKITAWKEVKTLRYFPGESLDTVVEKIKSLLQTVEEEKPNDHLVAVFLLDALPEKVSNWVKIQFRSEMNLSSIVSASKNLLSAAAATDDRLESEFCHLNVRERQITSTARKSVKEDDIRCFCCKQFGHLRVSYKMLQVR